MFVTLTSPDGRFDSLYLANYATINLKDELARLPGVGNVNVFGAGQYSMRIWLDPEKLKARKPQRPGRRAVACSSRARKWRPGRLACRQRRRVSIFNLPSNCKAALNDVDEYENVIVKTGDNGEITRLRDVGRVELGAQTYSQYFSLDGKQAAGIGDLSVTGRQCP